MGAQPSFQSFSTRAFKTDKVRHWRDTLAQLNWSVGYAGLDEESFEAGIKVTTFGPYLLYRHVTQPVVFERTPEVLPSSEDRYFQLIFHANGKMAFSHYGRRSLLHGGDLSLSDNAAPARMAYLAPTEAFILRIPPKLLESRIAIPERMCNLPLSRAPGFADAMSDVIVNLWGMRRKGLADEHAEAGAHPLLDLLAATCAMSWRAEIADSSVAAAWRVRIKRHIEANLRDPQLSPASVAEACRLSPRYLRKVFAATDESVAGYIRRRRLEECADHLTSVLWDGKSVTEIAYRWGFSSSAHFSRAFKAHFGVTPTDFRHAKLARAE